MRSRDPDARLAERALREAWPVPEGRRAELVAKLIDVALAGDTPPRERVSAVKALLMAGRLNIEAIRTAQAADYEDVLARLEALQGTLTRGELAQGASEAERA
jgi:hypothetical protein